MTEDQQLALWYEQAQARHRHLPEGPDRELRVRRTFERIREEHEASALPRLPRERLALLLEEATLDVFHRTHCWPETEAEQQLFDARVDELFNRLCLLAREQAAPVGVRARLIARRLARRWLPDNTMSADASTVQRVARELGDVIGSEPRPELRNEAETYAATAGRVRLHG